MSKKKKASTNVILTVILIVETFCMMIVSLCVWSAREWYDDTSASVSQISQDNEGVTLYSVTEVKELSEEDVLVKNTVPEDTENYHYFLCTLEIGNEGDAAVDYLTLQAKNQNDDYISCYPIDYYQDISDSEHSYGRMVFPEYTSSRYDMLLAVGEEQMEELEELTVFEWGYDEWEEGASNYVSCRWEDVLTSSPVQ